MQPRCPIGPAEDPDDFDSTQEIKDHVTMPEELNFSGVDLHGPPPVMEPFLDHVPPEELDRVRELKANGVLDQWVRPKQAIFQRLENETGIPYYREWSNIEQSKADAVAQANVLQGPLKKLRRAVWSRDDRSNVQALFEATASGRQIEAAALTKQMSPRHVKIAEELGEVWKNYTRSLGFTDDEHRAFFADFPKLRKAAGNYADYAKARGPVPRMMHFLQSQFLQEMSPLRLDERETDFYSLGMRLGRMLAHEKHLTEPLNEATVRMDSYLDSWRDTATGAPLSPDVKHQWDKYIAGVLNTPDDALIATMVSSTRMMKNADKIMQRITRGKFSLGSTGLTERDQINLLDVISASGYFADLAGNTATFAQQFLQLTQMTIPRLGMKYGAHGVRQATQWGKEAVMRKGTMLEKMKLLNVTGQEMGAGEQFGQTSGALKSNLLSLGSQALEMGLAPIQFADSFTRVAAYTGKHHAVMTEGLLYQKGKITWQQFREASRLDLQERGQGILHKMVKDELDAGRLSAAAHIAADNFQTRTNFLYSQGNVPGALAGTMGRFLGRYGTWPLSFVSEQIEMLKSGDKGITKNKVYAIASTLALNAAAMKSVEWMFDADAARWSVWNAVDYRGGPMLHFGADLQTLMTGIRTGHTDNYEYRLAKKRVQRYTLTHIVPGTQSLIHLGNAAAAAAQGDPKGAVRALLGLQDSKKVSRSPAGRTM